MALNTQSPIPLYRQLADRLLADIDSGIHAVAAKIPSEHELAEQFEIGRPTVRQATDLLVRRGRLERRRGAGTFVLPPTRSIDVFSLAGTSAALDKSELDAHLNLIGEPRLEQGFTQPVDAVSRSETHDPDSSAIVTALEQERTAIDRIRVERVATVDSRPVMFETLWFDAELFPELEKQVVGRQSLSALVRDVYFLEPTSAEQTFTAILASSEQSAQLAVPVKTPVLRVYRKLHFGEHLGALHVEMICLTDLFEFSQTLYPARTGELDTTQRERIQP
ncbi:MAG: GntR family transcriptional regulator [Gammaproteobacteria bacterium]|nr:GntR family transcriptional regulator [Gammaproteobacteria bacterium]